MMFQLALHQVMLILLACLGAAAAASASSDGTPAAATTPVDRQTVRIRAWGVPSNFGIGSLSEGEQQVLDAFRQHYPWIDPVGTAGIVLPGARSGDMIPFMQIAGGIAPDVLYVNFRQSQTYISMKLLHPLEQYVEAAANVVLRDSSSLSTEDYVAALRQGDGWADLADRVLDQHWPVMRRRCPYELRCPYREELGLEPLNDHQHIWTYPIGPVAMAMKYDKTLLAEHTEQGIEIRTPHDWEELLRWGKILTDPATNTYGFRVEITAPGWTYANFLYSAGGQVVESDEHGNWRCVIDSDAAVEAAYFWARLRFEKVMRDGKLITRGVVMSSEETQSSEPTRYGFHFTYLDDRFFSAATDMTKGLGPLPAGPTGLRRGEFNSMMLGIFSGLAKEPERRDAAWAYIQFYDGEQARRIRTEKMVEAGLGPYVRRDLLEKFNEGGRYDSVIRRIPPGLEETYKISFAGGVPEPYGKNCQYVYTEMSKPLGAIWNSEVIRDAIDVGNAKAAKTEIRAILKRATERINEKMLGNLPPEVESKRMMVAWGVIIGVFIIFAFVLKQVFKAFTPHELGATPEQTDSGWRKHRYLKAWALMAPALLLIAIWTYWPTIQGTVIAFQDYSVLGDSEWVSASNFAQVLYSEEFWYSLKISLYYAVLFMIFGFWAPIGLAFFLSEVPRGKILFRTIYYLPAVLSGVVVIFLWKSFYGSDGMVNQTLNGIVWVFNLLPGVAIGYFNSDWLQDPKWVLFFCLLPTVWAGMGPGCLIYLAALKTVPDELYEAADLDGAGIRHKLLYVALPTIRVLVMINFVGAMIGAVRGAGGFMLAMTGGGPYGEYGGATEVVGLKIFYTTFGYLQFGLGAAMAWVLGAMLIGFTVFQLKRLSNLEFRTVPTR